MLEERWFELCVQARIRSTVIVHPDRAPSAADGGTGPGCWPAVFFATKNTFLSESEQIILDPV